MTRLNPVERRLQTAKAREETARGSLQAMLAGNVSVERLNPQRDRVAEALAMQGKYHDAALEAASPEAKKRYAEIHAAVWRDDEESCECPETTADPRGAKGQTIQLPTTYAEEIVYSEKHGREMPLVRCSLCGDANVTRPGAHLQRIVDAHAGSHAEAGGKS